MVVFLLLKYNLPPYTQEVMSIKLRFDVGIRRDTTDVDELLFHKLLRFDVGIRRYTTHTFHVP